MQPFRVMAAFILSQLIMISPPWETCISYEVFALGTSGNGIAKRRWAVI